MTLFPKPPQPVPIVTSPQAKDPTINPRTASFRAHFSSKRHPNVAFWSSFLLLNALLFLPIYWYFRADATFWPWPKPFPTNPAVWMPDLFFQRANPDIFRVNAELLLLVLAWVFAPALRRRWFGALAFGLYLAQLAYAVYEGFVRSFYLLDPVSYNDFFLFADGLQYVVRSMHLAPLLYVGGAAALALLVGVVYRLNRLLFAPGGPALLSGASRAALVVLGVLALAPLVAFGEESGLPETAVTSFTAKISQNIQLSRIAKAEADRFDHQELAPFYQFTQSNLRHKPDIYLIFVESYGSVLYKRPDFRQRYGRLLDSLAFQLDLNDWAAASARSEAPTWGGGSWLSYTSAMSGLRLDSHAQYLALFNRYNQEPFPHLFNYLRGQGYRSYQLTANSDELNDIEWQRYKNFYGVDEWLRYEDLQYQGPLYGWGPSPPDQYAINFAHTYMNQAGDGPHVFFYITQNSHYPWSPLPEVAADWRTLNDVTPVPPAPGERLPQDVLRQQYLASIEYEFNTLVDFILKQADEGDVFVLVGDHQPARVARYSDGWDTPIHIISKDPAFVEAFYEYGFVPGLKTQDHTPVMRHEGFYSLFMHVLLKQYGLDPGHLPEYRPDGIPLD